ncbi:MAG: hypothetical protein ACFHVJ_17135 [Aestuariibacter sp.]
MKGAGGTSGGIGQFFIGLVMMCTGFYLLLNSVSVSSSFNFSSRLFGFPMLGNSFGITGGMILIPFIFGIGIIFYDAKKLVGWILSAGSIAALLFGVLASVKFNFKSMTAFELIMMFTLAVGGIGLFLRSLKKIDANIPDPVEKEPSGK